MHTTPHPHIQSFIDYLKFEKRYSRHTVISYQTDLTAFFDYLMITYGTIALTDITHIYIRSWLATLKDEDNTAKTINRKISSLRSFFKYQIKTGVLQQNPTAKVIAPKNEKRLPGFVADKDMDTLMRHMEFPDNWQGKTERLLLMLFYQTGMRLSEVINLQEQQINFAGHTIKVLGKGNKERVLPAGEELLSEIKAYIAAKNSFFGTPNHMVLLVNEKGKQLYAKMVYTAVKKYLRLVTTIEKRSPHILRHTFATHLTNNGADLNAVKELLGHSSLAATQVYTHNTIDKLKNIYMKAHPKA